MKIQPNHQSKQLRSVHSLSSLLVNLLYQRTSHLRIMSKTIRRMVSVRLIMYVPSCTDLGNYILVSSI